MTYTQFIAKLRVFVGDLETLTRDAWDGDASTTGFRTTERPILESSYTLKVGGVAKTETTDYSIDKDTGMITFVSAPAAGSDNVTLDYKYVRLKEDEWLEIIKNVIREWRLKMWTDTVDASTLTTTADTSELSLDSLSTRIIKVISVLYRTSVNYDFVNVDSDYNVKYMQEQNALQFRPYFTTSGYELKIRYLEHYDDDVVLGDTVADDLAGRYFSAIQYKAGVEYLDRFMAKMVTQMGSKITKETYQTLQSIIVLKREYEKKAEVTISRVKPIMPATNIAVAKFKIRS